MQVLIQNDFIKQTQHFDEYSQVWIYYAPIHFEKKQLDTINQYLNIFLNQWNAHKVALEAVGMVLYNHCIVLSVNKRNAQASGCSVDASVRFIKDLGIKIQVDFFRRDLFFALENDVINSFEILNIQDIFEKNPNVPVMAPFYLNLKQFRDEMTQSIPFSAYKRMVKF